MAGMGGEAVMGPGGGSASGGEIVKSGNDSGADMTESNLGGNENCLEEEVLRSGDGASLVLSESQRRAMGMLLSGASMVASARAAGVTRLTLYRWMKNDADFRAVYNAWQADALLSAKTKLLALADRAMDCVAGAVGHDARIAVTVLKSLGVMEAPKPGATDPKEVEMDMKIEAYNEEAKRNEAMAMAMVHADLFRPTQERTVVKRRRG
jgi:hypothetical protein